MTQYHTLFKRDSIPSDVVKAIRRTIKAGLFKKELSNDSKKILIRELNAVICTVYELPIIPITFNEGFLFIGAYAPMENKIILNKPSLVTYLHEFYHYLAVSKGLNNSEENARGFSHSLYYIATPHLFINAVNKGLLVFQKSIEG